MWELTSQTFVIAFVTGIAGLILGGAVAYIKTKYKGQKEMVKCTEERLNQIEVEITEIRKVQFKAQRREIINTYRFYKSKRKIPEYEMEEVEDIYREYSRIDDNGIIKRFMEQMRTWTTSEERE